jgi:uncharacterized protein (UPF0276 family)
MILSRLPADAGVGFKPQHFDELCLAEGELGFVEIHAENYMGEGGRPHAQLAQLCENFALSVHGVGLSIGSAEALDRDHLARLKRLCDRYQPASFSEHLAWSSHDGVFLNDLLPLPYTRETLDRVVAHIDEVQSVLGRQMLLENPATYVTFTESRITETDFLAEIVRRTGCGLLLDVNNAWVSAINHGDNVARYLARFPIDAVREIHLAGHHQDMDDTGARLLIDAHGSPTTVEVWNLYDGMIARTGPLPTLIEWDNDVPQWSALLSEAQRARVVLGHKATA